MERMESASDSRYFALSKNNVYVCGDFKYDEFLGGFLALWGTPQLYPLEGSSPPKVVSSNTFPALRTHPCQATLPPVLGMGALLTRAAGGP